VQTNYYERRLEEYRRAGNRDIDVEQVPPVPPPLKFVSPPPVPLSSSVTGKPTVKPVAGLPSTLRVNMGDGMTMDFVLIPAGTFVMGNPEAAADECPRGVTVIEKPFYMSKREVSNREFQALVDAGHFSGFESWRSIDWRGEGHPLHEPTQPAVRVSWHQAIQFCEALTAKTGRKVMLPSEAQWEWACRAGTTTPFWYGGMDTDFSKRENLAGREREKMAFRLKHKWFLRDNRHDDAYVVSAPVGSYQPNPWGLHDMHGNVAEWTRSRYTPTLHPQPADADPNDPNVECVVRGGSWDERPVDATAARRWKYPAWRNVYYVGFRVVIEP
jgi:formylglycine-generating enzyme required for sulfatase activity